MRGLAGLVSAVVVASAQLAAAQSCPCDPKASVGDAKHGAVAVFEGHVQDVRFLKSNPPFVEAQMRVVRGWKGVSAEQVTVVSPPLGIAHDVHAPCTYAFEPAESYLVYAVGRASDGRYEVSACGRTQPIQKADEDLAQLGMGSAPVSPQKAEAGAQAHAAKDAPPNEAPARGGCASCSALGAQSQHGNAALPALVVLGFAASWWRLRKRRG